MLPAPHALPASRVTRSSTQPPKAQLAVDEPSAAPVSTRPRRATRPLLRGSDSPQYAAQSRPTVKYPRTGKRGAPQAFPRKLFEILGSEPAEVISWSSPGGASFVIKDMDIFITVVLEKYFRHQKYSSFQRQLNLYGFKKMSKGSDVGAYAHKWFVEGRPDLLAKVRRMPQSAAAAPKPKGGRLSASPATVESEGDMSEEDDEEEEKEAECVEDATPSLVPRSWAGGAVPEEVEEDAKSEACGPLRAAFSCFDFDEKLDAALSIEPSSPSGNVEPKEMVGRGTPPMEFWGNVASMSDPQNLVQAQQATFDGFVFEASPVELSLKSNTVAILPLVGSVAAGIAVHCFGSKDDGSSGGSDSDGGWEGDGALPTHGAAITTEPGRPPVAKAVAQPVEACLVASFSSLSSASPKSLRAPSPADNVSQGFGKLAVAHDLNELSAPPPHPLPRLRSLSMSSDDWAIEVGGTSPSGSALAAVESADMTRW